MKHPKHDYEMMLPDAILKQTLASIEKLPKAQRSWLTQVYRGNIPSSPEIQEWYTEARTHLMRLGYVPASEELDKPVKRVRRGRGSY
jgi:hypothetical protein